MYRSISLICVLILAAVAASAQPATITITQQYTFAPLGIAGGQTMRLNVANVSVGTTVCMVNLSYVGSDGATIKNETVMVPPGQTMSYSLAQAEVAAGISEIRGIVKIERQVGPTASAPPTFACTAVSSLELGDATGTRLALTNPTLTAGAVAVPATPSHQ